MRAMAYRVKLGDFNTARYVISNAGGPSVVDLGVGGSEVFAPAIKMTIPDLPDEFDDVLNRQEYLEQFEFHEDNWENPEFRACYKRVICGEDTGWQLSKVGIARDWMQLVFTSKKRYREIEEEDSDTDNSPYYAEVVDFRPNKIAWGGIFRFDVERQDGLVEYYQVTVTRDRTDVEEHIGNQIYNIRFDNKADDDGQWATIEWYC